MSWQAKNLKLILYKNNCYVKYPIQVTITLLFASLNINININSNTKNTNVDHQKYFLFIFYFHNTNNIFLQYIYLNFLGINKNWNLSS
jgi:hypothetical protein